jgi:tetratricopeptide (TPR) repeat protein
MNESSGYEASLQRGQMLRCSGRYREACEFLGEAIQADPHQAQPYLELALTHSGMPGGKAASLQAVNRAVALEPGSSHFLGWKAVLLAEFHLDKEAIRVAQSALEIDPHNSNALMAQANAGTHLKQWKLVESLTRRVLELNPHHVSALNLLAQSLRFQDRIGESRQVIERLLAFTPNDAFGHANAGYAALQSGDHLRANRHFLEALRFDPGSNHARRGLLQSLRARIWIYRFNFRLLELLDSTQAKGRTAQLTWFFLALLSGGLVFVAAALFLPIALTQQPLSNFFLLLDRTGRRALTKKERIIGLLTGLPALALCVFMAEGRLIAAPALLGGYLGLFALGVYIPQWIDLWRVRREKQQLEREGASVPRPLAEAN